MPRKSAYVRATRRSWITRSPGIPKFALRLPKHNWLQTSNSWLDSNSFFIYNSCSLWLQSTLTWLQSNPTWLQSNLTWLQSNLPWLQSNLITSPRYFHHFRGLPGFVAQFHWLSHCHFWYASLPRSLAAIQFSLPLLLCLRNTLLAQCFVCAILFTLSWGYSLGVHNIPTIPWCSVINL